MFKNTLYLLLTATLTVLLGACQSHEYYQEQAVNRAREFLIKNTPELTVKESQFVRYNKPVIMIQPILGSDNNLKDSWIYTSNSQYCITWLIPGRENAYVVYGTSSGNLYEWRPLRIIKKRYVQPEYSKDSAIEKARLYALNNLLFLTYASRLKIRFDTPKCIRSSYEITSDEVMRSDFGKLQKMDQAKAEKFLKDNQQLTMYWKSEESGKQKVVVVGYCSDSYKNWMPITCELVGDDEFKQHLTGDDSGIEAIK